MNELEQKIHKLELELSQVKYELTDTSLMAEQYGMQSLWYKQLAEELLRTLKDISTRGKGTGGAVVTTSSTLRTIANDAYKNGRKRFKEIG